MFQIQKQACSERHSKNNQGLLQKKTFNTLSLVPSRYKAFLLHTDCYVSITLQAPIISVFYTDRKQKTAGPMFSSLSKLQV